MYEIPGTCVLFVKVDMKARTVEGFKGLCTLFVVLNFSLVASKCLCIYSSMKMSLRYFHYC